MDTALGDLVAGLDSISSVAVPVRALASASRRLGRGVPPVGRVAAQTPSSSLQRPKFGDAAVRALIESSHEAVQASQQAGDGSVGQRPMLRAAGLFRGPVRRRRVRRCVTCAVSAERVRVQRV